MYKIILACALSSLSLGAFAENNDGSRIRQTWLYSQGELSGYLQTPAGGSPGTTTTQRPTFEELQIDTYSANTLKLEYTRGRSNAYLSYTNRNVESRTNIAEDLTSQKENFSAGEVVDFFAQLDLYRIGYQYRFGADLWGNSLILAPGLELAAMDFHYRLHSDSSEADRAYSKTGVRGGLQLEYQPWRRISLVGETYRSIAIEGQPHINSASAGLIYRAMETQAYDIELIAALSRERLDYDDGHKQEVPNHIHAEFSNSLQLGFRVSF